MKKLVWLLFITAFNLSAQDVISNPPLEINPESGRQMAKDAPVDGQLKLEENKAVESTPTTGILKNEEEVVIHPRAEEAVMIEGLRDYSLEKYFQFSLGYLDSQWKKANSSLGNGSILTNYRIVADMNQRNQFGFAIEMIHDSSGESIPENIRVLQYKLFIDHHRPLFANKLDWIGGLALSIGDFSIRKFGVNGSGNISSTKIYGGSIYGIIPSAGLRFYLGGQNSIDISAEYHFYLSTPQSYIGGFAFIPRFSFVF